MAYAAVISYLSPKGRKMQYDISGRNFAEILVHAERIANRDGVRRVKVWSPNGRLLAAPRRTRLSEIRLTACD